MPFGRQGQPSGEMVGVREIEETGGFDSLDPDVKKEFLRIHGERIKVDWKVFDQKTRDALIKGVLFEVEKKKESEKPKVVERFPAPSPSERVELEKIGIIFGEEYAARYGSARFVKVTLPKDWTEKVSADLWCHELRDGEGKIRVEFRTFDTAVKAEGSEAIIDKIS